MNKKIDLTDIPSIYKADNNIWFSTSNEDVSYPSDGNSACFQLEDRSYWFHHRSQVILDAMKRHTSSGSVLDVGGGNGFMTRSIQDNGYDAVLIEPGLDGALNAYHHRGVKNVICSTLNHANLKRCQFDAACIFDVLEHIENHVIFLNEISEVLKPGGKLYITVPAHCWLWSQSDEYAGHYRRYTLNTLSEVVGVKFRIIQKTHFFTLLVPPLFLMRSLPHYLFKKREAKNVLSESKEHGADSKHTYNLMMNLLRPEIKLISKRVVLPFGTSILCVAEKI